mmetsp:Transcript_34733/g.73928  ORF Transcript_34733/g.73928 Transcript_34733/m.73928 type:complete len:174 (+) Transcript_34733:59-580(+)|eukprot:CAMPEP_0206492590 /NCGR_PEP_ID=MMETSP0324_2-20121206/46224_1 /ASSEMBLY_ACC=CAM_ASM_000836 /TAXON_ID=2866 /ORGANISM="Crypthecodinium cohnii, Strain Seligo" /LENGTH=173 /DNA_ID=CAMNT_0053975085 /DNA_START=56 /DNA_END=577 /DNA_ORIENTATION=+
MDSSDQQSWRTWQGEEVSNFLANQCNLPEYTVTAKRNLTGKTLGSLRDSGLLSKGLSRAGIYSLDHQQRIASALSLMDQTSAEELKTASSTPASKWPPTKKQTQFTPSSCVKRPTHLIGYQPPSSYCNLLVKENKLNATAKYMQQRTSSTGALLGPHQSADRRSLTPYDTSMA